MRNVPGAESEGPTRPRLIVRILNNNPGLWEKDSILSILSNTNRLPAYK